MVDLVGIGGEELKKLVIIFTVALALNVIFTFSQGIDEKTAIRIAVGAELESGYLSGYHASQIKGATKRMWWETRYLTGVWEVQLDDAVYVISSKNGAVIERIGGQEPQAT